jgi:hypothetical protein
VTETDPIPEGRDAGSGAQASAVSAEGEVPFAVLPDRRVVMARFRTTSVPQPTWSPNDAEVTEWTLALDGREFRVTSTDDDQPDWLPISHAWVHGGTAPLIAVSEGERYVVHEQFFYGHHLGWLSGMVRLAFDLAGMTVEVGKDLTFERD